MPPKKVPFEARGNVLQKFLQKFLQKSYYTKQKNRKKGVDKLS